MLGPLSPPHLHLAAGQPKPGETWGLFTLSKSAIEREVNPVHFFGGVRNCEFDVITVFLGCCSLANLCELTCSEGLCFPGIKGLCWMWDGLPLPLLLGKLQALLCLTVFSLPACLEPGGRSTNPSRFVL